LSTLLEKAFDLTCDCDDTLLSDLFLGGNIMAWKTPVLREIECGMEINMYGPEGDEDAGGVSF
jgi:coenzyme PQQ precursor peptide PqqA